MQKFRNLKSDVPDNRELAIKVNEIIELVEAQNTAHNNRSDEIAFLLKIKAAYIGKFDTSQDQNFFVIDIDERVAQLRAVR